MYENYFREFHVSEHELKEKIHSTIKTLMIYEPETSLPSLLEDVKPDTDSEEVLEKLFGHPAFCDSGFESLEGSVVEKLRLIAIELDTFADGFLLNHLMTKMIFKTNTYLLLYLRYVTAVEILQTKLDCDLLYDSNEIGNVLHQSNSGAFTLNEVLTATRKAQEEIDRLCSIDIEGDLFSEKILDFEGAVESYVEKNLVSVARERFGFLLAEGISENVNLLSKYASNVEIPSRDINEILDKMLQMMKQNANRRVGRTPGGARKRQGFSWGNQEKLEFYKTIESFPKLKWKNVECDIWLFAYKLLENAGEESVKSHTQLKELPSELFAEALGKWRSCFEMSVNPQEKAKSRMFMFRHALQMLEFPEDYVFSTLQKHYETGRKLFFASNRLCKADCVTAILQIRS